MAKTTFTYGSTSTVLTSDLEVLLKRLLDTTLRESSGVLLEVSEKIADAAIQAAPVKTGKFRESIGTHVRATADEVRAGIHATGDRGDEGGSRPYGYMIKYGPKGPGPKGKNVYQETIRKPMMEATKEVVAKLARKIDQG